MKKLINEISEEELLNLIEKNQDVEVELPFINAPNDVLSFVSIYGLKQGKHSVYKKTLYQLYYNSSKNPITYHQFLDSMNQLFKNNGRYYEMNKKPVDLIRKIYILKEPKQKIKSKAWKAHFDKFLARYDIKPGTVFIRHDILYNLYDKWTYKNQNYNPLGERQFNSFCRIYFKEKRMQDIPWFAVDSNINQHLTEDLINRMKKKVYVKKENKKIGK